MGCWAVGGGFGLPHDFGYVHDAALIWWDPAASYSGSLVAGHSCRQIRPKTRFGAMGATQTEDVASYEPVPEWGRVAGVSYESDATSVAVDSNDNVFVFNRGPDPMIVFDRSGDVVDRWGHGDFDRPHGIWIDGDDNLFLVDTGGHFVQKRSPEGKVFWTVGTRGEPAELHSGRCFNMPTDVVVHPVTGDLFITDGYGNSRVHHFDGDGGYITSWGEPGADDGQLSLPHGIALLDDDRIVVCDRENFRLQFFSPEGEYLEQRHAHHPSAVRLGGPHDAMFVAELGTAMQHGLPNLGCRVVVRSRDGSPLGRIGAATPGFDADQLFAPHGIAVDSRGDVYVAEVNRAWMGYLRWPLPDQEVPSLRKWRCVEVAH